MEDSVLFKNRLHVEDELLVDGNVTMEANSTAREDFTIEGNLYLPNLEYSSDVNSDELLFIKSDGSVLKSNLSQFIGGLYAEKECTSSYLANPYWMNSPNKLFTHCPEMNVGIRTSNPEYALDVRGTGYFEDKVMVGAPFIASMPAYFEGYASINNARPWMRFTTLDNGIDKTAFLVEKNGNVYCTALRIRYSNDIPVPDYVFKSDYKLMPLTQVKQFVTLNSHLPNIPSEAEIQENGLSVEEMQFKLLEKVEELTLYVIQLEEQRIEQNEKLLELQKEIKALKAEIKQNN